jgi:dsRNA-specific ribonuclease
MTDDEKKLKREELAVSFGLGKRNKNFHKAFDCSRMAKRNPSSTGGRENSSLATVGDAIIRLYLTEKLFGEGKDSAGISKSRAESESNRRLKAIAEELGLDKLKFRGNKKKGAAMRSDHATLLEAVIGAVFLTKGYKFACKILDKIFGICMQKEKGYQ